MMLFHMFASQEERRSFGGSAFIEMQFCKLPLDTEMEEIVSVSRITYWKNDSLYICDEDLFFQEYGHIFDGGTYNNLKSGMVDLYGINYYPPALTDLLIERVGAKKPLAYEILTDWLYKARAYNGFYLLGI